MTKLEASKNSLETKTPEELKKEINSIKPNDVNALNEMAKKFWNDAFINRLDSETVKSFVNKVSEKWDVNSMTEMSKNLKNDALINKLDNETTKSFVNKALDKNYDECVNEIAKNKKVMNKLDEETKNKVIKKDVDSDPEHYLEANIN